MRINFEIKVSKYVAALAKREGWSLKFNTIGGWIV
jgi:hypothetical protein